MTTMMMMRIMMLMIVYMVVLGLAYLASTATLEMQQRVLAVSMGMQKVLRLTAIHMLEATESVQLHQQASYNAYEAQVLEQESQQLQERASWEQNVGAQQDRQRGQFLSKLAAWDQTKANAHWHNVERDQELHQQIMANLTLDTERHEETLQELEEQQQQLKMHANAVAFCNMTSLLASLCNAIGSVASLQEKSDHEALLIQKEWNDATLADQDQVMEMTVVKLLQRQADEYNETSQKLLAAATAWDERAQDDYETSRRDHVLSQSHQAAANELERQAQREEEWNAKSNEMVHVVLMQAQIDHVAANYKAVQGILCAVIVLIFLIPRAMSKVHVYCTALGRRQRLDIDNNASSLSFEYFGHGVSAFISHVLIFLLVIGIVGDYFVSLQDYDIEERAVIILWFAMVAATLHVLVLHGIRAVYTEMTIIMPTTSTSITSSSFSSILSPNNNTTSRDWSNVCWQLGKRLVVLCILFMMEVLFSWLIMGNQLLFQSTVVAFLSTWVPFRFCAMALLMWHVVCMDFQELFTDDDDDDVDNNEDGESTVSWLSVNRHRNNINNNNNRATEATPLNKQEILSVATPIDIYRATAPPANTTTTTITATATATTTTGAGSNHHRYPPMMHECEEATTASQQDDGTLTTTLTANTLGFESTHATTATTATTLTATTSPRHYYSFYQGFSSLLLPLEIFLITCMVTIVTTDLQVVWHSQARIGQCLALLCVVVLLILACVMIQRWTTTIMGDDDKMGSSSWSEIMTSSSDISGSLLLDHDYDDDNASHKTATHYSFIDSINPYKTGKNSNNNNSFGMFSQPQKLPHYELVAV